MILRPAFFSDSDAAFRRDINDCMRKYNDKYRVVLAKIMADTGKWQKEAVSLKQYLFEF